MSLEGMLRENLAKPIFHQSRFPVKMEYLILQLIFITGRISQHVCYYPDLWIRWFIILWGV